MMYLYVATPHTSQHSDGICNKDPMCVKLRVRGTRGWNMKQDSNGELHCLLVDIDTGSYGGIMMMEVINLAEMSEYFSRYC